MGRAVKLWFPIVTVLVVLLPTPRLAFLSLQGQSLWWHLFNVVPPLLVRSNLGTPSTWLLLLTTAVNKPILVPLSLVVSYPRPIAVPSFDP